MLISAFNQIYFLFKRTTAPPIAATTTNNSNGLPVAKGCEEHL